jgi:hypothetical protein
MRVMNHVAYRFLLLGGLLIPGVAGAALPIERELERESSVVAIGIYDRRLAGLVEYSKDGVSRRQFGPWIYDTDRTSGTGETMILEDGSVMRRDTEADYRKKPDGDRRCETVGNVTVCK